MDTPNEVIDQHREILLRDYAAGKVSWSTMRRHGFDDYVAVLGTPFPQVTWNLLKLRRATASVAPDCAPAEAGASSGLQASGRRASQAYEAAFWHAALCTGE